MSAERTPFDPARVRAGLEALRGWTLPVTKRAAGAAGTLQGRRLPQITNPLLIGAIGVGVLGAGAAVRALRPHGTRGRDARIAEEVREALDAAAATGRVPKAHVGCELNEGFGKPVLVALSLDIDETDSLCTTGHLADLLECAARAAWNNGEVAPVSVRVEVRAARTQRHLVDLGDLGGEEIWCPEECYRRFGQPAADAAWRP